MQRLPQAEYLGLGRQLAHLLGSCLEGASGDVLRELARAYDPSANEARISAEVFLFHKYLLMQSCVGVFPNRRSTTSSGDCSRRLNERASVLELSPSGKRRWSRCGSCGAAQFDQPFSRIESNFLMKGQVPSTGNRRSSGFARTCVKSKTLPTFGPGPMAHPKPRAALSPQHLIRWWRPS